MRVDIPSPNFDISRPRRLHIVAIGGAGMSAIATILVEGGHHITGSDLVDGPALVPLRDAGVHVHVGHAPSNIATAEALLVSTAVQESNPEVFEARRRGLPVLRRTEFLPSLASIQPFLSVAGTHGKTTTASFLAVALRGAGSDPSFLIGAHVPVLGGAAALRGGPWMVLEADESDGSFLAGPRAGALLTNAEPDHLEYWGGWESLRDGFRQFLQDTDGPVLTCADDEGAAALGAEVGVPTWGTSDDAIYRITDLELMRGGSRFVLHVGKSSIPVEVGMPGLHNATNAAGAIALVAELGLDPLAAADGVHRHTGLHRRFEHRGEAGGVVVVDDYAHLPTEVRAALAAGADGGWERLVVVFQPHRYSRTEALWHSFGPAFDRADVLVLTDIFPAGEEPRTGVSGHLLVDAVREARGPTPIWAPGLDDVVDVLESELRPGDLLLTVGAGDVRDVGDRILERLRGSG